MIFELLAAHKALVGKGLVYSAGAHLAGKIAYDTIGYKKISNITGSTYQQLVERDLELKPSALKSYWEALGSLYAQNTYISTELCFKPNGISVYNWIPDGIESFVRQTLNGLHPAAQLTKCDDPLQPGSLPSGHAVCAILELDRHPLFPLEMPTGEVLYNDPLNAICAAGSSLPDDSAIYLQILTIPLHRKYFPRMQNLYGAYAKTGIEPHHVPSTYSSITGVFDHHLLVASGLKNWAINMFAPASLKMEGNAYKLDTRGIAEKIASGVLFDTVIRLYSVAGTQKQANTQLATMAGAFMNVSGKNRFRVVRQQKPDRFYNHMWKRRAPMYPTGTFLCPWELGHFAHFPNKDIPFVKRLRSRKLPVPEGIFTYRTLQEAWADHAIVFGSTNFQGRVKYVAFKNIRMLMQHMYVIGATGSGKSTFLIALILQIMRVAGVTFPDVKGTTIKLLMQYIPPADAARVNYIDLSSKTWYPMWNFLKLNMNPYDLTSTIVNLFVSAFGENAIQYHSKNQLRNGLLAVIVADPDGTIIDVYRMFEEAAYRIWVLEKLKPQYDQGEYTNIYDFWTAYHEKPTQGANEAKAIINKLRDIHDNLRPKLVTGHPENRMQFRDWFDAGSINLINLDIGQNLPEVQSFFAKLISVGIRNATFSRSDIEKETDRRPHIAILDEFEEFEKSKDETERALALYREYGVGLGLTHQSVAQINGDTMNIIRDNTFTQICLNVGDKSGKSLADLFPRVSYEDLKSLSTEPQSSGGEGLEGVCLMKKLSPEAFTFYVLEYWQHFKNYGTEHMQKVIEQSHTRLHAKGADIEKYLAARKLAVRDVSAATEEENPRDQLSNGKKNKQVRAPGHRPPVGTLPPNRRSPILDGSGQGADPVRLLQSLHHHKPARGKLLPLQSGRNGEPILPNDGAPETADTVPKPYH